MRVLILTIVVGAILASQVQAETLIQTPPIDSPLLPGHDITVAQINEPTVGKGSTPDGVKVDQVFQAIPDTSALGVDPVTVRAGADNNEPVLTGRKMLAGRNMLESDLSLTGDGTQIGADGAGVTTTLAGHGQSGILDGEPTDTHIRPHSDDTTVTAAGESISTGAGVNPDNLAGEYKPLVYTTPGRK